MNGFGFPVLNQMMKMTPKRMNWNNRNNGILVMDEIKLRISKIKMVSANMSINMVIAQSTQCINFIFEHKRMDEDNERNSDKASRIILVPI